MKLFVLFFLADNSMQDWNYLKTNDFEVTIELSCEKIVTESSLKDYWNENKYALFSYLGQVSVEIFLKIWYDSQVSL